MNGFRRTGFALLAATAAGCAAPPPAVDGDIAFVDVNVVSMLSDEVTPGQTVIVDDGIIVRIVPEGTVTLADGIRVVDGAGRYLMPALADMHTHVADSESLKLNVAYGVTALRNLWGVAARRACEPGAMGRPVDLRSHRNGNRERRQVQCFPIWK